MEANKTACMLQADLNARLVQIKDLHGRLTRPNPDVSYLATHSAHARKHAKIAFHPDKQPDDDTRMVAEPLFKQVNV